MNQRRKSSKWVDIWINKKLYLWVIGDIIILAMLLYYMFSGNQKSIELISFIASIASIVLAITSIIIGKYYNKATGEVLKHIELSVASITDELQHRLNSLEEIKLSVQSLPENSPEKEGLLNQVQKMEEVIITSPLLASARNHHEDNEIRKLEKRIRFGQRKLDKYNNDSMDSTSDKEKTKIHERMNHREDKIKSAEENLKKYTEK